MKKVLLVLYLIVCSCFCVHGQSLDSLFVDVRGAFQQDFGNKQYSNNLRLDYFNLHIFGTISPKINYRVRQRFNVIIDSTNPFRATDWLSINWKPNEKWTLSAGKGAILIGGYEYDAAPIDVYYYSQFCDNLKQGFSFGANVSYHFNEKQTLTFQVCNSPLTDGFTELYAYNLAWQGHIAPWWETLWSVNLVEDIGKKMMNYIALGNHMVFNKVFVDVDLLHRASFRQKNYFFTDYSIIAKAIWNIGRWNICGKWGYEHNSAENVDADGISYDSVLPAGKKYIYGGVGVEYFPLGNERLRLHLAFFGNDWDKMDVIQLGLKWKFYIINKNK